MMSFRDGPLVVGITESALHNALIYAYLKGDIVQGLASIKFSE